jgi:hypothetical protein
MGRSRRRRGDRDRFRSPRRRQVLGIERVVVDQPPLALHRIADLAQLGLSSRRVRPAVGVVVKVEPAVGNCIKR